MSKKILSKAMTTFMKPRKDVIFLVLRILGIIARTRDLSNPTDNSIVQASSSFPPSGQTEMWKVLWQAKIKRHYNSF